MLGKEIAGYRILSEIAEGGMGIVYQGESVDSGNAVALKVMRSDIIGKRNEVGRFIREAVIYKRLRHPNLIDFQSFGFDPRLGFFLVTELLNGWELEDELRKVGVGQTLPREQVLDIVLQVCAGLGAAHEQGIVHRDLKPANIFLVPQEKEHSFLVKVFDFGIGHLLDQDFSTKLVHDNIALGTPLYMAPEQIRMEEDQIGPGSDIYALGVILFQMLTGRLPFTGRNPKAILAAHLKRKPPLLRKHNRFFANSALEELVSEMLEKEILDRPASLDLVKQRLWEIRQEFNEQAAMTIMEMPAFDMEALMAAFPDSSNEQEEEDTVAGTLILREEPRPREVGWLLRGETLTVGSTPGVDVRLRVMGVRPRHAEILCDSRGIITIRAVDQSLVRVNGAAIRTCVLRHNDFITVGNAELQLQCF